MKYKVGDRVLNTRTGKKATVTALYTLTLQMLYDDHLFEPRAMSYLEVQEEFIRLCNEHVLQA